jgi:dihydrofolate synthase/folylpolyglutamate synthase
MNYTETMAYLYANVPMFHTQGARAYKPDLGNIQVLDKAFEHPHKSFITIHIAGTNGKGSVSHMLASVLMSAGYKTGLYTSPHLYNFRERIRVNGQMISEEEVTQFIETSIPVIEQIQPSFFEVVTEMAFDAFARHQIDVAVIETGLGGRLDATNIIQPVLSIITNIGLDHTDLLGDTISKIAFEKAGIIKPHTPVIIGEWNDESAPVFMEKAQKQSAPISFASKEYSVQLNEWQPNKQFFNILKNNTLQFKHLEVGLSGLYQATNSASVLCAIEILNQKGFHISENAVLQGFARVSGQTGLQGRWQQIGQHPLAFCDTAHNAHGLKEVMKTVNAMQYNQLYIVLGMVKDKDIAQALSVLSTKAHYIFTQANIPRALDSEQLKSKAEFVGLSGETEPSVAKAWQKALAQANGNDLIIVCGSNFVVGELLEYLQNEKCDTFV